MQELVLGSYEKYHANSHEEKSIIILEILNFVAL